jgi:hypothetical protein
MEASNLLWYNSVDITKKTTRNISVNYESLPGFSNYAYIHEFFANNLSMVDRYNTINLPISMKILDVCQAPEFKTQDLDYETICVARARWFMDYAKSTNRKIFLMWSGGIDSSTIVCSFILACTPQEIKENIVVGMSEYSIRENPSLYKRFVMPGFEKVSSHRFTYYMGHKDYITITGEGNDQLFGSAVIGNLLKWDKDIIGKATTNDLLFKCFNLMIGDRETCNRFIKIFNCVIAGAPVPITTIFQYFWWINFSLKWQCVYMRILGLVTKENAQTLQPESNYFTFFHTPEFQLWSLNNSDKLIKGTWNTYKYVCKDLIFKVNNDEIYRENKCKRGSLSSIAIYKDMGTYIDENFKISYEPIDPSYWNNINDFV